MRFIDEVTVHVHGGDGGAGSVHWRREKFVPRGGPDGGDGGNGGAVIFRADPDMSTLLDYSFNPIIKAKSGGAGAENQKHGADGKDTVCSVPVGTQVFFEDQLVADLSVADAHWIAARGGRGGKGNTHFKSATNQAPEHAQPGTPGEIFSFRLVLKSVADIGVIGFPNVGKSTLISKISAATPKVADYPFTTLVPQLGVVEASGGRRFVIADIPGLISGASEGKGLGIRFLKHVERTKMLLQLIDLSEHQFETLEDKDLEKLVITQFEAIEKELHDFSPTLLDRKRHVAISKGDIEVNKKAFAVSEKYFKTRGLPFFLLSSVDGNGIAEWIDEAASTVGACEKPV